MTANSIVSCDPIHQIHFLNNSSEDSTIRLNLNPNTQDYELREMATGDSIVFNLKENGSANIGFGIGTWSDTEIENVSKSIKSIEIETKDIKTIYKSQYSIINILKKNRKGFLLKTQIELEVE